MTIRKFALSDKIKREFFQSVAVSELVYGCTTWKRLKKELDVNYTWNMFNTVNNSTFQNDKHGE